MSLSTNTTYRVFVEKLGSSDPAEFIGDQGELFYDPSSTSLYISDGSTPGGVVVAGGGGGSQWTTTGSGIYYNAGNVAIGTNVVGSGSTTLLVDGNARITGILTIGTSSITLDPSNNTITASGINIVPGVGSTTIDESKWIQKYRIVESQDSYFSSARFDSQGKIVCSGADGNNGIPFVIKFDTDGSIIWKKFFENLDPDRSYIVGETIAIDKNDDSIYTGILCDDTVNSTFLVKLDSSGNILWQKEVASVNYMALASIAVASSGNVYFGIFDYDSNLGFTIIKFDSDGNEIWQRMLQQNGDTDPGQVAVDSDENIYFTCDSVYNDTTSTYDLTLVKLDSDGNGLWQRNVNGSSNNYDSGYGVAIDSQNNPYVVGTINNGANLNDSILIKFDPSGNIVWQRTFEAPSYQDGFSIAIDENDLIYIITDDYNNYEKYCYIISSFDSNGNLLYSKRIINYNRNLYWWYYYAYNTLDVSNGKLAVGSWSRRYSPYNAQGELIYLSSDGENIEGFYGFNFEYEILPYEPVISTTISSVDNTAIPVITPTYSISSGGLTEAASSPSDTQAINYKFNISTQFDTIVTNKLISREVASDSIELLDKALFQSSDSGSMVISSSLEKSETMYNTTIFGGGAGKTFLDDHRGFYNYGNSFFGANSGERTGSPYYNYAGGNSFFGSESGRNNLEASYNSFFGIISGCCNTTGVANAFFGAFSGVSNTTGNINAFFGLSSGSCNTTGNCNTFIGPNSGNSNTSGSNNIVLGSRADVTSSNRFGQVIIGNGPAYSSFTAPGDEDTQLAIGGQYYGSNRYWLVGNSSFNVGIGVTNPTTRLEVGGDVKVGGTYLQGIVLTDANQVEWKITMNTDGTLGISSI